MKNKRNWILSFLVMASVVLAGAVIASAQDARQIKPPTSADAAKASKTSRKVSKKGAAKAAAPACGPADAEPNTAMPPAPPAGQDDPMDGGKDHDLSGTYTGTVNYADGNLSGPATLTINGSSFTLAIDGGETLTGRISAVNTRGYIGATLRFGERSESDKVKSDPIPQVSVRARKIGSNLSLMSVPEDTRKFSFVPGKMSKKQKQALCG